MVNTRCNLKNHEQPAEHNPAVVPTALASLPKLEKVLGRRDLVLLFVVAVANLNIVPAIAASGPMTLWLWLAALSFYFWPQGVAVTELSAEWPGEGGIYLWTKNSFGDLHAFIAGWSYWLANVVYLPTVLLSAIGAGVFIFGPKVQSLADNAWFTSITAAILLLILLVMNILGESVGKWITNIGGLGTFIGAAAICILAGFLLKGTGSQVQLSDFRPHLHDWQVLAIFGTICYSLQGLDLASIMGDEIKEPRKILPGAIFWGGVASGLIYVGVTLSMLVALKQDQIGILTGMMQSISVMAGKVNYGWIVAPFALFMFVAILGTASAWFSGTARLPFVAGIDRYLPPLLGRLHPRYHTPYVALICFAILSALLILLGNLGASVSEGFVTLLAIAVVLQLIPNIYMFAALIRHSLRNNELRRFYNLANGIAGATVSCIGIGVAFIPTSLTGSIWIYELKLCLAIALALGTAFILYGIALWKKKHDRA
jgi:amino acid transporter